MDMTVDMAVRVGVGVFVRVRVDLHTA
jgi:hypothetical protein